MTTYLTGEDALVLVTDLQVGPIRDLGLLISTVSRPATSLWGRETYPGLDLKAAVLLESVVTNHPLVDGNKRLGWLSTVVFYGLNNVIIEAPDNDAYDMVVGVASGAVGHQEAANLLARWHLRADSP
ncbi:type II toxin-antitoxin system death-on-curing family toxin [Kocuria sp. cx-455]|uniref:type II toxin-antitoxin system death-on-curing family toxin n=1 Tax=Kocuria sp. cx-455 TaxID=2771377 RepID=UPI001682D41E|nr:type II toxin-antitoxin system death-on-curing family toxin [Kocuria sp. cx-455]MBD2765722.1 type II toxin-antitoxin system death-on-curing family toxin [Kocuria sp. cx-455]